MQEREGKGERDQVEGGLVLIVREAVAIGGRLWDVRRPGNVGGLFDCNERLSVGDALSVVEFVLPRSVSTFSAWSSGIPVTVASTKAGE